MKKLSILCLVLVFLSCGGGDKSASVVHEAREIIYPKPQDTFYDTQWYLNSDSDFATKIGINKDASVHMGDYIKRYRGKGVKIVVIDDGINENHEDLKGNVISFDDDDNLLKNHGTAVTGLIAAKANNIDIYGIANMSDIYFVPYNPYATDDENIIQAFEKADKLGADIINCSWGTKDVSDSVKEVITHLSKNGRNGKGTLIVFATGNDNANWSNDESQIPQVISVGASNAQNIRASYSNFGKNIDVLAPGGTQGNVLLEEKIILLNGNGGILYGDGTSFSAPIVSGILALLLEANPNLTREQVEQILAKTSDKIGDVSYENGHNLKYGYGKINAKKAIDEAVRLKY